MLRLNCVAQSYEWGKPGATSAVANLKAKGEGVAVDAQKPYAEYWFGTHTSGPSKVVLPDGSEELLQDWLLAHPSALGSAPYNATSALPYLFKVLSVAKALSVQSHPDKALAEKLHASRPDLYKDDNHKPEMACALTPFEAMCGFRSPTEIAAHLASVPELREMVGEEAAVGLINAAASLAAATANIKSGHDSVKEADFKSALRRAFTAFMTAPADAVAKHTSALESRLASRTFSDAESMSPDAVARRLCAQYPGDVGVFAPYWLNTLRLEPGQAIFLGANAPHAYLAGDCMEVMACSDNVIRAGLTPKFKDVDTLCSSLTYECGAPDVDTGKPESSGGGAGYTVTYTPPVPEFVLQKTSLPAGTLNYRLPPIPGAAIIVVVSGSVTARCDVAASADGESKVQQLSEGQVWLQSADVSVELSNSAGQPAMLFRSHANAAAGKQ